MSAPATAIVAQVTTAVDYLRIAVDPAAGDVPAGGWLRGDELLGDRERLLAVVRSTAAGRGTDRDDVAMSLFVQGYAFRVASAAIGGWLVADAILDVSPARTAIALGRHRPNALALDPPEVVATSPEPGPLVEVLVEGHLRPLVRAARDAARVGEALLWANVAAACASSFGAFASHDRPGLDVRARAGAFFDAAAAEVGDAGRLVAVGTEWAWERGACCLWYRTDTGSRCSDCSLWSAEERQVRYDEAIAAQGAAEA